jgi:hypothetical protein
MQGLEMLSNKVLNNTFFAMASIIAKLTTARDLENFVQYRLYIVHCNMYYSDFKENLA